MCQLGASDGGERDFYNMLTPANQKATVWMDGYNGEEDVVIEDYNGEINYRIFLRMLDKYANLMQVKGGTVQFSPKRIWISTNIAPRMWYPNVDIHWEESPLRRRLMGKGCTITKLKDVYKEPESESEEELEDLVILEE